MVSNLRVLKEEMEKIKNEHLIHELEEATMKTKKQGRILGEIKPQIGDLVWSHHQHPYTYIHILF